TLYIVEVSIQVGQRVVLGQELDGRLFANPLHAGDIVADVADEGFIVDYLVGPDAEVFHHTGRVVYLAAAARPARGQLDAGVVVHQLQQVAVAGDDVHRHFVAHLRRDRAQYIVSLVSFQFEDGNIERPYDLLDAGDLNAQLIGHFFPRALVIR